MKRIALLVGLLALALVEPAHAVSNESVYSSSHTSTADTSQMIAPARVQLYKVIVSSAGTGTATVTLADINGRAIGILDATAVRDVQFDVTLSTGLVYSTAGSIAPQVTFLYTRSIPNGQYIASPYSVFNSTGVYTTRAVRAGRVFLKRVIVGKGGTSPSALTIYNSNGAVGPVVDLLVTESTRSVDYNVLLSSGLSYTSTGNPNVTFVYGNTR